MAPRFGDGFDHYATADITAWWTARNGTNNSIQASAGRFGSGCWRVTAGANSITRTLDAQASWVVGLALRANATTWGSQNLALVSWLDAGTQQCELRLDTSTLLLNVTRNGTALTGGTASAPLAADAWQYIEWKVTVADSIAADSCRVRLNGAQVINVATGQDTKNTANATANQLRLGSPGAFTGMSGTTFDFDDLYVCDGTGASLNDFLGDRRVEWLPASGPGHGTPQWTPNTGTNWAAVSQSPSDGDTTYVSSGTAGHLDLYDLADLATVPSNIAWVQTVLMVRKDDAGSRTVRPVVRSGGDNYPQSTVGANDTYTYDTQILATDPATGQPWEADGVNDLQLGPEVVT